MLSDEEKKAIEYLKRHIIPCYGRKGTIEFMLNDIVLSLIEKQSKEIEELKTKERLIKTYKGNLPENVEFICLCKNDFERNISDDYISKDKIKVKIKELEIEQESNREDLKIAIDNLLFQNIDKIADKISINMSVRDVLQSLLEKE